MDVFNWTSKSEPLIMLVLVHLFVVYDANLCTYNQHSDNFLHKSYIVNFKRAHRYGKGSNKIYFNRKSIHCK